jgi:hypothetical protein
MALSYDEETMQRELEYFVKEKMYDSAEILGSMLMGIEVGTTNTSSEYKDRMCFQAKSLELYADALMGLSQHKRALVRDQSLVSLLNSPIDDLQNLSTMHHDQILLRGAPTRSTASQDGAMPRPLWRSTDGDHNSESLTHPFCVTIRE